MHRVHGWIGRKDRAEASLDAVVRRADGDELPVKLTNLSDDGCCLQTPKDLTIGERLAIAIPGKGELLAQIRWALQGQAGAQFVSSFEV